MIEKYPLIAGEVAFVKATDEPVFIAGIGVDGGVGPGEVLLRRAIQTNERGAHYVEETWPAVQLHSEKQRLIKELEFTKFNAETRDKYAAEYQKDKHNAKPGIPVAIAQADGGVYEN